MGIGWLDKLEMSVNPDQLGYRLPAYLPSCPCLSSKLTCSGTCPVGGWPGGWPGGRVAGWVAGLIGNIAISAQLELELGLSLAKKYIDLFII